MAFTIAGNLTSTEYNLISEIILTEVHIINTSVTYFTAKKACSSWKYLNLQSVSAKKNHSYFMFWSDNNTQLVLVLDVTVIFSSTIHCCTTSSVICVSRLK